MTFNTRFQLPASAIEMLGNACPAGQFLVRRATDLPAGIPPAYLSKVAFAVVMHSISAGSHLIAVNFLRIDAKDGAIDQDLYGACFPVSGGCTTAGILLHGSWADRTIRLGSTFFTSTASAASTNYPTRCMPAVASGALTMLSSTPHLQAFSAIAPYLV
jgi:hypothetical protein